MPQVSVRSLDANLGYPQSMSSIKRDVKKKAWAIPRSWAGMGVPREFRCLMQDPDSRVGIIRIDQLLYFHNGPLRVRVNTTFLYRVRVCKNGLQWLGIEPGIATHNIASRLCSSNAGWQAFKVSHPDNAASIRSLSSCNVSSTWSILVSCPQSVSTPSRPYSS